MREQRDLELAEGGEGTDSAAMGGRHYAEDQPSVSQHMVCKPSARNITGVCVGGGGERGGGERGEEGERERGGKGEGGRGERGGEGRGRGRGRGGRGEGERERGGGAGEK